MTTGVGVSRETVTRMAEDQVRYVRLPLMVTWVDEGLPCISVATNEMRLPEDICAQPVSHIRSVIGHELGHPVVFPRNAHWSEYYTMFVERLGYADPQEFVNIIGDLFVNLWNATRTPWKLTFRSWARSFYKVTRPDPDPRWAFMVAMMQGYLDEIEGKEPALKGRIEEQALELLFHDARALRQRFEDLAELLRSRLGGEPLSEPEKVQGIPADGLETLDPMQQPQEFEEWVQAVRDIGAGAGFAHITKQHDRKACLFDIAELLALGEYMVVEDEASREGEKPSGPQELDIWTPSDSALDLRIGDSVRQWGVVIPGLTTLKRVNGIERTEEKQGRGTLFLIVDTSGSMEESLAGVLVLGWAAALGARKRRDRVAALEFSSTPSYVLAPGHEYRKLKEILQKLQAGGGTRIGPALSQVIDATRSTGRKPTCLILTDTDVRESPPTVLTLLAEIQKLGGRTLVCVPQRSDIKSWVRDGQRRRLLDAFVLNDLSSIHSALKALR